MMCRPNIIDALQLASLIKYDLILPNVNNNCKENLALITWDRERSLLCISIRFCRTNTLVCFSIGDKSGKRSLIVLYFYVRSLRSSRTIYKEFRTGISSATGWWESTCRKLNLVPGLIENRFIQGNFVPVNWNHSILRPKWEKKSSINMGSQMLPFRETGTKKSKTKIMGVE